MLVPNPYFRDSEGKSKTREVVLRLIAATGGPVEMPDGSSLPAAACGPSVPALQVLYENPPKDIAVNYVGRASKVFSSVNPDEEGWCVAADIAVAVDRLTQTQKDVITLRHVFDYTDASICSRLNLTLAEVADAERLGLDKLVALLDMEDE
jgi:hypothetical protein